jgi:hypothetical protein
MEARGKVAFVAYSSDELNCHCEEFDMNEGAGKVVGALGFIGIIVLLNVLSYAFNWGWYFY